MSNPDNIGKPPVRVDLEIFGQRGLEDGEELQPLQNYDTLMRQLGKQFLHLNSSGIGG